MCDCAYWLSKKSVKSLLPFTIVGLNSFICLGSLNRYENWILPSLSGIRPDRIKCSFVARLMYRGGPFGFSFFSSLLFGSELITSCDSEVYIVISLSFDGIILLW